MRLSLVATLATIVTGVFATPVPASPLKERYSGLYHAVAKKHGDRAPGRNIRRLGVRYRWHSKDRQRAHWATRPARERELARSIRQLRLLLNPKPFLAVSAGSPFVPPAGTATARYAPTGLAACIVHHESGGDPDAVNGSHTGIAQWDPHAWAKMGGLKFAPSPLGATYQEQLHVLSDGLARFGCVDWCPFDPC
ncbi:MAG: transglycosylase family protein [Baekduia sp.]